MKVTKKTIPLSRRSYRMVDNIPEVAEMHSEERLPLWKLAQESTISLHVNNHNLPRYVVMIDRAKHILAIRYHNICRIHTTSRSPFHYPSYTKLIKISTGNANRNKLKSARYNCGKASLPERATKKNDYKGNRRYTSQRH